MYVFNVYGIYFVQSLKLNQGDSERYQSLTGLPLPSLPLVASRRRRQNVNQAERRRRQRHFSLTLQTTK